MRGAALNGLDVTRSCMAAKSFARSARSMSSNESSPPNAKPASVFVRKCSACMKTLASSACSALLPYRSRRKSNSSSASNARKSYSNRSCKSSLICTLQKNDDSSSCSSNTVRSNANTFCHPAR